MQKRSHTYLQPHIHTLTEFHSCQILFPSIRTTVTFLMRSHKTRSTRDRSIPRSLQKMSFEEILDLTTDVFSLKNIIHEISMLQLYYNTDDIPMLLEYYSWHIPDFVCYYAWHTYALTMLLFMTYLPGILLICYYSWHTYASTTVMLLFMTYLRFHCYYSKHTYALTMLLFMKHLCFYHVIIHDTPFTFY